MFGARLTVRESLRGYVAHAFAAAPLLLDFLLKQIDGVNQLLWAWRTSRNIHINGDDLDHALYDRIVIEDASRCSASAHRNDPLGFWHLFPELTDDRRHLLRYASGND